MKFLSSLIALWSISSFGTASARAFRVRADVDPATTDPYDDPFYTEVPSNINTLQPGAIIKNRTVTTTIFGNFTKSVQLKYKTIDGQGKSVVTVATLWIPLFPRNPPSIFAYQYAEDAINLDCAPSWAWIKGSKSDNRNVSYVEGPAVIPQALTKGYYVVQADAEGPNSTWLVGNMEGKAVLDAIRATINFNKLDKTKTRAALYGYSGGAHSTVWAAELRDSYASDINIVGAAYGGTPVDLQAAFQSVNGGPEALLGGGALFGLAQGYPALEANFQTGTEGLNAEGLKVVKTLRTRNNCINSQQSHWAGTDFNKYFKKPLLQNPVLKMVTDRESLLMNVSSIGVPVPKFPRFQYHSTGDVTVPFGPASVYVQQQCAKGANIQFRTYPGTHGVAAVSGLIPALNFIDQAFNGRTPTCQCGTDKCPF